MKPGRELFGFSCIDLSNFCRLGFKKGTSMSAPQTNIEKQKRWHRGPLIGMALVTLFGVAMIFFWLMGEAANDKKPGDPEPAAAATTPAATDPAQNLPKAAPAP